MKSRQTANLWLGPNPPEGFKKITESNLRGFKWSANVFYKEISDELLLNMHHCPQYRFFKVTEQ